MADMIPQGSRPIICCGRVLLVGDYLESIDEYYRNTLYLNTTYVPNPEADPDFDLNYYGLIFISVPTDIPSWWGTILSGDWHPCMGPRRIHLNCEHTTFGSASLTTVNAMALPWGMSVELQEQDCECNDGRHNPVYPHHLTVGMSRIHMACTSKVIGGTRLSKTVWGSPSIGLNHPTDPATPGYIPPGVTWLAAAIDDGVELVVAGDSNHLGGCTPNNRFYRNLWTAKTP